MGPRSKHRKDITARVTTGLPPQFCQDVLGLNLSSLRQFKKRSQDTNIQPALLKESRSEGNGRVAWSPAFEAEIVRFFESRTEILSGANTHTRKLLMNKGLLEAEFYAELPALLRRAVQSDPDMRPDDEKAEHVLTIMQKNVLAAECVSEQPDFSEAEEYKSRLDAELQRLLTSYLLHRSVVVLRYFMSCFQGALSKKCMSTYARMDWSRK